MPSDPTRVFIEHRSALVNYANAIVGDFGRAEDVVQEAFLRFRSVSSGRLLDEPVGYLYRIVRNLALDLKRRLALESRHVGGSLDAVAETAAGAGAGEAAMIAREELRRVAEALAELPERTRIALEMHRFGGFKLREIADHLGISVSMAQVLVVEGVKHCESRL